jgi:hypothetical protein
MKAVRALFIVLFNVAVVAPLAASPRVPAAAWPGVSDVLLNVRVAASVATWSEVNDSEQPGSVLVFPKYRNDTQTTTDQGVVPNTGFALVRMVRRSRASAMRVTSRSKPRSTGPCTSRPSRWQIRSLACQSMP